MTKSWSGREIGGEISDKEVGVRNVVTMIK
jgi:hypothetical protein